MNRPLKNKMRGKQHAALPAKSAPATAMNVMAFDGRTNTAAGKHIQQFAMDDVQGSGNVVGWIKSTYGSGGHG